MPKNFAICDVHQGAGKRFSGFAWPGFAPGKYAVEDVFSVGLGG